jgi:hypothetical protein
MYIWHTGSRPVLGLKKKGPCYEKVHKYPDYNNYGGLCCATGDSFGFLGK